MGRTRRVDHAGFRLSLFALLALLGAFLLRLPTLQERPFHTDEAVNAFILEETIEGGFHYRPSDHHGPTLYLIAAAVLGSAGITQVSQMDAWMLRSITALSGALLAGSVYFFFPYIRAAGVIASALLLAVLAPFVYYSGIFIHESFLVLFLSLYLATFWRWLSTGNLRWAFAAGLCAGLMLATKETAAPILIVVALSAVGTRWLESTKSQPGQDGTSPRTRVSTTHRPGPTTALPDASACPARVVARPFLGFSIMLGVATLTVLLVFSSFGRYPERAFSLFNAVGAQVSRGLGEKHAYPWWTYLRWFCVPSASGIPWSGWLLPPLALFGAWSDWKQGFTRTLAFSTVLILLLFSALPYKTPWLMLAWEFPLVLLAGIGIGYLWDRPNFITALLSFIALILLGHETLNRCHRFATDPANALAYSPSSPDLKRLEHDLELIATKSPSGHNLVVQVVAPDYWPLPWTLRHFPHTGYWSAPPAQTYEGIVLCGLEFIDRFPTSTGKFQAYSLRPGVYIFMATVQGSKEAL